MKEIGHSIASRSGHREVAIRFMRRIGEHAERYARQPEMGKLREELGELIRSFTVSPYVIFYQPIQNGILLLTTIHGARDIPPLFRQFKAGED